MIFRKGMGGSVALQMVFVVGVSVSSPHMTANGGIMLPTLSILIVSQ